MANEKQAVSKDLVACLQKHAASTVILTKTQREETPCNMAGITVDNAQIAKINVKFQI